MVLALARRRFRLTLRVSRNGTRFRPVFAKSGRRISEKERNKVNLKLPDLQYRGGNLLIVNILRIFSHLFSHLIRNIRRQRYKLFLNDDAMNDDEKSGQKQVPAATKFIKKLNVVRTMPDRRRS